MAVLEHYMLPCLNKTLFGFECVGCGIQRSALLLYHGEFSTAFYMYPAIYSLILFFGVIIFNQFKTIKYSNTIIIGLAIINVALMLGNYILKLF